VEVMVEDEEAEQEENIITNLETDDVVSLKELLIEQVN
jgi:hypothetical protein